MKYKKIIYCTLISIFFSNYVLGDEEHLREHIRRALLYMQLSGSSQLPEKVIVNTLNDYSHLAPNAKDFSVKYALKTFFYTKTDYTWELTRSTED